MPTITKLQRKIEQITGPRPAERDIYPFIRDLLTISEFGLDLQTGQIAVDSPIPGIRDAPDLAIYLIDEDGKSIRSPDHCFAVIEVKLGDYLADKESDLLEEKRKYIQVGTRHFFLIDQVRVIRFTAPSLSDRQEFTWAELVEPSKLEDCFGPISSRRASLDAQLAEFRRQGTPFADIEIGEKGRSSFIQTVRTAVRLIVDAVDAAVVGQVVPALHEVNGALEARVKDWGAFSMAAGDSATGVEFAVGLDPALPVDRVREYLAMKADLLAETDECLYALDVERNLLPGYAARMGIGGAVSLLSPRRDAKGLTASGKAVENFIYETSSLIISRMLMIRFSEDNGLLSRMISNGGVAAFGSYADHFGIGMQALVREAYRKAKPFYASLFGQGPLDWVLHREDPGVSRALLHAMFLLNRWNFRTVTGDILAGVYDQYLEPTRRRDLGEVFTRPEIADYVLSRCARAPTDTVFDPSCGSGTFLVQRLTNEIDRLKKAGAFNLASIATVLGRIAGLDINPFSVTLAQMQMLWHLLDLLTGADVKVVQTSARRIMAAIHVEGGHTSLETFGTGTAQETQMRMDFDVVQGGGEGRRSLQVSASQRFKALASGRYDAVVGNPPYVRAHRATVPEHIAPDYKAVAGGQNDLYVAFLYRALTWWTKPGGRVGFVVPITVLTAGYGSPLRRLMANFKLLEIVDLEGLGKRTFRGVKRQTVILILENTPPFGGDMVRITRLSMSCYDPEADVVDMAAAAVSEVPRSEIVTSAYHPRIDNLDEADGEADGGKGSDEWLSKVQVSDIPVLKKIAASPRLRGEGLVAHWRALRDGTTKMQLEPPPAAERQNWRSTLLIQQGLELGGRKALTEDGRPVFRGQNVFAGGLKGDPTGRWTGDPKVIDNLRIYKYETVFRPDAVFVGRKIAQLPTMVLLAQDEVVTNSCLVVALRRYLPLHYWVLARPIQWFAAKTLRSNVIEDFGASWVTREFSLLPAPSMASQTDLDEVQACGVRLVAADEDLFDSRRLVRARLDVAPGRQLQSLIVDGDPRAQDFGLTMAAEVGPRAAVSVEGDVVTVDGLCTMVVPAADLRAFISYRLEELLEDEDVAADLTQEDLLSMSIPDALGPVAEAIAEFREQRAAADFEDAHRDLDRAVGRILGLTVLETDYVAEQMSQDGFLRHIHPNYAWRGFKEQAYGGRPSTAVGDGAPTKRVSSKPGQKAGKTSKARKAGA